MLTTLARCATSLALLPWLLVPAALHAGHETGKFNCDGTQLEMNYCAAAKSEHADNELNAHYQRQMNLLRTTASKARLRDAQRAWLTFRDKACLYEAGPPEESGTSWPLDHFGCMERITIPRIQDMLEYLQCTTPGCPE